MTCSRLLMRPVMHCLVPSFASLIRMNQQPLGRGLCWTVVHMLQSTGWCLIAGWMNWQGNVEQHVPWLDVIVLVCCKITWSCKLQACVHWWTKLTAESTWFMAKCLAGMAYGSRQLWNFMPFTPHSCCNFGTRLGFGCIVDGHMNPFTIVVQ